MKPEHSITGGRRGLVMLSIACILALPSCAGKRLWLNVDAPAVEDVKSETPVYTIYAIGDAGLDNAQSRTVIAALADKALDDVHPGMIIFLGDNIYPAGFAPPSEPAEHERSKAILSFQVEALRAYHGHIIFIAGNHDWNEFKPGGLAALQRQASYLSSLAHPNLAFVPRPGCAGPEVLSIRDDLIMIILDSQWWIQDWTTESGINDNCDVSDRHEFREAFHKAIETHQDKQIIVALHHPLMTRGHHGGYFTLKDHLFPLTKVAKWLWVPLPVIGSIYPWYRSVIGHPQDLRHPRYRSLRDAILNDLAYDRDLIFLSGHDHNLQYLLDGRHHFLLSGGGAKQNFVANGRKLQYGHKAAGFMQLDFFQSNEVQLTVTEVDPSSGASTVVVRKTIIR